MGGIKRGDVRPTPRLTDYQTFWKLVLLVVVSVMAEAGILYVAIGSMNDDYFADFTDTHVRYTLEEARQ